MRAEKGTTGAGGKYSTPLLTRIVIWWHDIGMARVGNLKWNGDDGSYARIVEKERQQKKAMQDKCEHPDHMVVCLCRACLKHLEKEGYVARKKVV